MNQQHTETIAARAPNTKKKKQTREGRNSLDPLEIKRLAELHCFEVQAREKGYRKIAGVDEAGRGPLAGPVVAAACMIEDGVLFEGVDDSKRLTPAKRRELYEAITSHDRVCYSITKIDHETIDAVNIYQATILAMIRAVDTLDLQPDFLLVDGLSLPHASIPCERIIKGDTKSHSIAAASVLAKEARDRMMLEYHEQWPCYGFDRHKGYGTAAHIEAIKTYGPCPIHRKTFEPVRSLMDGVD